MPTQDESEWYIARNGQQVGPISASQIDLFQKSGRLQPTDDVWSAELGEWKKASKVFRFAPPPPPPPSARISEPQVQPPATQVVLQPPPPTTASNPLGKVLQWMGIILIVGSVIWWAVFFSAVANAVSSGRNPPPLSGALECLFHSGGACGAIGGIAQLAGYMPYQPLIFWIGVAALVFGVLYRLFATPAAASQGANPNSLDEVRIYDRNGRIIIRQKNGSVIVKDNGQYIQFPSIARYREQSQDTAQWEEIADPATKQNAINSVPASLWTA